MTISENERIIIYDLEIENFKSYAGRRKLGPFHKSFTSVVGANGSGKSNVIDAILFVFGYRAAKIRSRKLGLLVHNSARFPAVDSCSVTVHFRKLIDEVLCPEFELAVMRTARKDATNDYYIDGRKSNFSEVRTLLKSFGIDLDHNRFLILQGEVEQISLMKPKGTDADDVGLLEFMEDIIGTAAYKNPIEELTKAVDDLQEHVADKANRVKIVEKDRDVLEVKRKEAMKFIEMENRMNMLMYKDATLKLEQLRKNDAEILDAQNALKTEREEVQKIIDELEKEKNEKQLELSELQKRYNPLIKAVESQTKSVKTLERRHLKLKQDLNHAVESREKIENDLENEKSSNKSLISAPTKSQADLDKLRNGKNIIENEIKEVESKIESLLPEIQSKTKSLQEEKEQKDKILLEKAKLLSDAEIAVNMAKNTLDSLVSKRDYLTTEIQKNKKKTTENENKIANLKEQLVKIEKELPALKKRTETLKTEYEQRNSKYNEITATLTEKRQLLDSIKSSESSLKNRSKIITELLKLKESGNFAGIFGRLGDLAAIDPSYDCAISSCCSYLDHCLVDTMDTAMACVEHLRKNKLGIASFIALEKMQVHKNAMETRFICPANSSRLFDLINITDPKFKPAFYFALRDTLVTENIDSATKIAFSGRERYRVATFKGDIVEKNGTITSGGQPIRGRIKLTSDRNMTMDFSVMNINQNDLIKEIEDLASKQAQNRQKMEEFEKEILENEKNIEKNSNSIQKSPKEIEIYENECQALKMQREKLEGEYSTCLPDQNELHKTQMNLDQMKKGKETAQTNYDLVNDQIRKIVQQISAIRSGIVDRYQTELVSKKRLLDDINSELSKATAAASTNARLLQKSEKVIADLEASLEKVLRKIENIEIDYKKAEIEFNEEKEKLIKLEQENSGSTDKIKIITEDLQNFDHQSDIHRKKLLDIKLNLENINSKVQNYDSKVKQIQTQIEKLVQRSYDEDGNEIVVPIDAEHVESTENTQRTRIHDKIDEIKAYLDSHKCDLNVIEEYCKKDKIYRERVKELDEVMSNKEQKNNTLKEMKTKRLNEFIDGFTTINLKLKEMYQLITMGGDAELELVDSLNPFSEGIIFSVRPPKKSWKHIANLSGGEKTLSSLSLVFALHHYKPTPFYVMDEIDAALDFKNVSIVANYIKERTQNAQFIIISLRDNMFELANRLVGIYKTDDCTKSVILDVDMLETVT